MIATAEAVEQRSDKLDILLIEDDPVDARILNSGLRKGGPLRYDLKQVATLTEAREILDCQSFDVVLLDLHLPDGVGLECVRAILECCGDASVIVLSGSDDEELAIGAVGLGAQDYLVKGVDRPKALQERIRFAGERQRLRKAVEELRQRENEMKDRLLSHVSHELRTPLAVIDQFAAILHEGLAGPVNEEQRRFIGIMKRNTEQLTSMVSALMDATRATNGKLHFERHKLRIATLLAAAVASAKAEADEKGVDLQLVENCDAEVIGDSSRLTQVLTNLIGNSIKFTPSGGSIRLQAASHDDEILVSVEDTGCGLPSDLTERVFERLYQVDAPYAGSRKGLGLGLHICREIVAAHGGRIWAESRAGEGSTFFFVVPRWNLERVVEQAVLSAGASHDLTLFRIVINPNSARAIARGIKAAATAVIDVLEPVLMAHPHTLLPSEPPARDSTSVSLLTHGLERTAVDNLKDCIQQALNRSDALGGVGFTSHVETGSFEISECTASAVSEAARYFESFVCDPE